MKNLALAKLQTLSLANALPHAWLFSGPIDHSKAIAIDFCKWLLCTSSSKQEVACGECKSCNLFDANVHPDFCIVAPQDDKSSILMDDVRVLPDFIVGRPQLSGNKIVLLYPAETMHKQAANSILKSLEEPSGNTKFFLLTRHTDLLLKTIVSRCQVLHFNPQSIDSEDAQLAVTQIVSDLNALWVLQSVSAIKVIEQWVKKWPKDVLFWLELVLLDLIRFKYTQDATLLVHTHSGYLELDRVISSNRLWSLLDKLRQGQVWFGNNQKPNLQLLLEDMLIE